LTRLPHHKVQSKEEGGRTAYRSLSPALLRVSDIVVEIETRLRSLRLQAQKAERYKRYKAELKDLDLCAATQKHFGLVAEQKFLLGNREQLAECHTQETTALLVEETAIEAERLALSEEMAELATAKEELFAIDNKARLSAQKAEHYADEAATLAQRAERSRREIEGLLEKEADNCAGAVRAAREVVRFDEEAEARSRELEATEQAYAADRSSLTMARQGADQATARPPLPPRGWHVWKRTSKPLMDVRWNLAQRLQVAMADDGVAGEQVDHLWPRVRP